AGCAAARRRPACQLARGRRGRTGAPAHVAAGGGPLCSAAARGWCVRRRALAEQSQQLADDGLAKILDAAHFGRVRIETLHIVIDADGRQLHAAVASNLADHGAQVSLQVLRIIRLSRGVLHRLAIADDQQDAARLAAAPQTLPGPQQRLAVDVVPQQLLLEHRTETGAGAAPGLIGTLVDDVAQFAQASGPRWAAVAAPALVSAPAAPGARRIA